MTIQLKNYKNEMFTIERVGIVEKIVFEMLKKTTKHTGEYGELFNPYESAKDIPSGSIVLICKRGTDNVGILIAKTISINKHEFVSVQLIDVDDSLDEKQGCILTMLAKLYEIYSNKKVEGIIADYVDNNSTEIVKALDASRFKEISNLFAIVPSKLSDVKKDEDIEVVSFDEFNKKIYSGRLTDLLIDHDEHINKSFNDSVGKRIEDTKLKGDSDHERKMRFFIESLAKDDRWLVVLINQKAMTLGYAKVKVLESAKVGFVDAYNDDKEKEKIFELSLKELSKLSGKKLDFFVADINITYKEELKLYEKVFGKSIGSSYFLSI